MQLLILYEQVWHFFKFNVWRENMKIIDKIKQIEKYICENFEEWDLEDPVEEYLDDYHEISGASEIEIVSFEKKIGITLPNDVKEIYKYKNGSKYLSIFPCIHR